MSGWWHQQLNDNVAEWVGGIGTIGALVFAGWQIRRDRIATDQAASRTEQVIAQTDRSLALQAERDRRDLDERERAQAALISCAGEHCDERQADDIYTEHRPAGVMVTVMNNSPAPIYDVCEFVNAGNGRSMGDPHEVRPGGIVELFRPHTINRAVPAGQCVGITFRDNAGRRWIKWGDGHLLPGSREDLSRLSPTDSVLRAEHDPRLAGDGPTSSSST